MWTPELVARVKTLATEHKMSAELIAREVNHVVTRSAIIGKLYRLGTPIGSMNGLVPHKGGKNNKKAKTVERTPESYRAKSPRKSPRKSWRASAPANANKAKIRAILAKRARLTNIGSLLWNEGTRHHCYYIAADPRVIPIDDLLICGKPVAGETAWCRRHSPYKRAA